jgi:multicomponent Na+:H+ antiporter subunit D
VGIAFSGNLFTLYIFYELLTLATFPLVIHAGTEEALASGKKYMMYSFFGATLVLLGMLLVFSITNDLSFAPKGIVTLMHFGGTKHNEFYMLLVGYLSLFIGFGVKAALAPFHSWLPNAMVAPTPVSALLHAVAVVKSGIFSLIRTTYYLFGATAVTMLGASKYLLPVIVLTIVMGSLLALHQDNLKKRLAYSTISQLGYITLGIALLNQEAFTGALLHLINHAVIKITLFFVAGAVYYQTGFKYVHQLDGIGKRMKATMLCFAVSGISLIGIPPTNGFVSKWFLALGALKAHNVLYVVALLASAFLTAAYLLPIMVKAFFSKTENTELDAIGDGASLDPPDAMLMPILILTAIVVLLGIFPNPIISIVTRIAGEVF